MPSGRILWIDPADKTGRIEAGGREYVVHQRDIEPRARASGAAVRFDVIREGVRAGRCACV